MIPCPFCRQALHYKPSGYSEHTSCGVRVSSNICGVVIWIYSLVYNTRNYQPQWHVRNDGTIISFRLYDTTPTTPSDIRMVLEITDGIESITPANILNKLSLMLSFQWTVFSANRPFHRLIEGADQITSVNIITKLPTILNFQWTVYSVKTKWNKETASESATITSLICVILAVTLLIWSFHLTEGRIKLLGILRRGHFVLSLLI